MTTEQLQKAKEIEEQLKTYKAEIKILENNCEIEEDKKRFPRLSIKNFRKKPTEKTHKDFWCSRDLDSIGSTIFLSDDEVRMIVNLKKEKVKILEDELKKI